MEFQDVVRRRRMVRAFTDEPVPRETVDRLLANALHAPSAGFSQGWAFVVLEGREQTARFWALTTDEGWARSKYRDGLERAPVIVLPMAHKQAYLDRYSEPDKAGTGMHVEENWPVPYWIVDTAFASLMMLLTTVDAGLGALFFGLARGEAALMDALGVPPAYKPIGAIAIGYPSGDDEPSPSLRRGRRGLAEVVHRGGW